MIERNDSMNGAAPYSAETAAGAPAKNAGEQAGAVNRDRIREAVSALFDGEASEIELRRLLGNEPGGVVREAWGDYQLQRDVLQGAVDMRFAGLDISARVRAAIAADAEPAVATATASGGARWWRPLASMAVAASVATVVVIGARGFGPVNGSGFENGGNTVAATHMNRAYPSLGNVSASAQPFGPLAAGNGLPGTVFPRKELVGNGFPAAQTVSFEAEQPGQQRGAQRYLIRSNERVVPGNQGVINFAKVRLSEE